MYIDDIPIYQLFKYSQISNQSNVAKSTECMCLVFRPGYATAPRDMWLCWNFFNISTLQHIHMSQQLYFTGATLTASQSSILPFQCQRMTWVTLTRPLGREPGPSLRTSFARHACPYTFSASHNDWSFIPPLLTGLSPLQPGEPAQGLPTLYSGPDSGSRSDAYFRPNPRCAAYEPPNCLLAVHMCVSFNYVAHPKNRSLTRPSPAIFSHHLFVPVALFRSPTRSSLVSSNGH